MSDDDDSLICPITWELFRDPVIAEDGHLYEREAITRWINENGTSPFTRQVLNVDQLRPDENIRRRTDQPRRLSATCNREADPIVLLQIPRPPPTIHVDNTPADRRDLDPLTPNIVTIGERSCTPREDTCSSCCRRNFVIWLPIIFGISLFITFATLNIINSVREHQSILPSTTYKTPPLRCYALNNST